MHEFDVGMAGRLSIMDTCTCNCAAPRVCTLVPFISIWMSNLALGDQLQTLPGFGEILFFSHMLDYKPLTPYEYVTVCFCFIMCFLNINSPIRLRARGMQFSYVTSIHRVCTSAVNFLSTWHSRLCGSQSNFSVLLSFACLSAIPYVRIIRDAKKF